MKLTITVVNVIVGFTAIFLTLGTVRYRSVVAEGGPRLVHDPLERPPGARLIAQPREVVTHARPCALGVDRARGLRREPWNALELSCDAARNESAEPK